MQGGESQEGSQFTYIDPKGGFFVGPCFDSVHTLVQLNREETRSICTSSNIEHISTGFMDQL